MLMDRDYEPLTWTSGFTYPGMIRIRTIPDGSCFFHAVTGAFFMPYRLGRLQDKPISKQQMIKSLRHDLSIRLGQPVDPTNPATPLHYDLLSRGQLRTFSQGMPRYSLEHMQKELNSSHSVDNAYNEYISNQVGKDIYLLDEETQNVRITGNDDDILYLGRPSIVLLYSPGHYELVGLSDDRGVQTTLFAPDHPFIVAIRQQMRELRAPRNRRSK